MGNLREISVNQPAADLAVAKLETSVPQPASAVAQASSSTAASGSSSAQAHKWIYKFGNGTAEGDISMKDILGGKGAGLHQMARFGLRVPPGFTLTTEACRLITASTATSTGTSIADMEAQLPQSLWEQLEEGLLWLESVSGAVLGGPGIDKRVDKTMRGVDGDMSSSGIGQPMQRNTAAAPAANLSGKAPTLLVSVRSGAAISMPGMMDTVLNLGIAAPGCIQMLSADAGSAAAGDRFALDCLRRHIDMFACIVMGLKHDTFEGIMKQVKKEQVAQEQGVPIEKVTVSQVESLLDTGLTVPSLSTLVDRYKAAYQAATGEAFPTDPRKALRMSVVAVLRSWHNSRAQTYRAIHHITGLKGTAVNIQAQVYGNMGDTSGSGVLFTRDPSTGEDKLTGEFLVNAQGEDVVAGIRTPMPIAQMAHSMPEAYQDLYAAVKRLEKELGDMQDVEFTVQKGVCYILQTRNGKRNGPAALRIAMEMVKAGTVDIPTALSSLITPAHVDQLLHKRFKAESGSAYQSSLLGKGIAASPGAAVGRVVFEAQEAVDAASRGERVILVRPETSAEDVAGMNACEGILTTHGGMTSHAAVVARGWGKTAVCGAGFIHLDLEASTPHMIINLKSGTAEAVGHKCTDACHGDAHVVVVKHGEWLSLNGGTGEVLAGQHERTDPVIGQDFLQLITWAKQYAPMAVRSNSDSGHDVAVASKFLAAGVGLCRTEHMFWGPERITHMRAVIVASTPEQRARALEALFPFQKSDFLDLFLGVGKASQALEEHGSAGGGRTSSGHQLGRAHNGAYPVTVRLLDPPLHEYLPNVDTDSGRGEADKVAQTLGMSTERLHSMIRGMKEANPMLGHRGCRVEITHPEIPKLQTRAVITAAAEAIQQGVPVEVQIMIPLITSAKEMAYLHAMVMEEGERTMREVTASLGIKPFPYKIGTMLETPRAALTAQSIAQHADFFSFGTNDLTALTFGFSRDDAPKFIPSFIEKGILADDPFQSLDKDGVGELVRMAVERGRAGNPGLEVGVCGEVGGDERSVHFFLAAGADYVSVSPYRVPAAWLASAQAGLKRAAQGTGGRPVGDATA